MKQCKSCLAKAEALADICPVCGIDQKKPRRDLTPGEKRIRRAARNIRLVAMLHLIGGSICIMILPEAGMQLALAAFAIINLVLAVGLIRYDYRAYKAAVVFYFALGIVNTIIVNLLAIPIVLLLLFIVGNSNSKAIFERRLPASA
ncbi:MAG TPA: hypothetical protein VLL07_01315 [Pontiella sp.]|nr:hypothetical protein [Pontiella sp.]